MKTLRLGLLGALACASLVAALAPSAGAASLETDLVQIQTVDGYLPETDLVVDDGDGYSATYVGLGPCGCYCPVVGGGLNLGLAGQDVSVYAATVLVFCGTGLWFDYVPGPVDATAEPDVEPVTYLHAGGLQA